MRPEVATSCFLDGRFRFGGKADGIALPQEASDAMQLAAAAGGSLAIDSPDDSLGRLVLPRLMALDEKFHLYLAVPAERRIYRYHPDDCKPVGEFVRIALDRELRNIRAIAVMGGMLYVVQGKDRTRSGESPNAKECIQEKRQRSVLVFDLTTGRLHCQWTNELARSGLFSFEPGLDWSPVDVVAGGGVAYVLDRKHNRVYRHVAGSERLCQVIAGPPRGVSGSTARWRRLAVDLQGRLYIREFWADSQHSGTVLRVVEHPDRPQKFSVPYPAVTVPKGESKSQFILAPVSIRSRFPSPSLVIEHHQRREPRFRLPPELAGHCPRAPRRPLNLNHALGLHRGEKIDPQAELFTLAGRRTTHYDPTAVLGKPAYLRTGTWYSDALDSQLDQCQWDHIELNLADFPPGTSIVVSTYTDDVRQPANFVQSEFLAAWEKCVELVATEETQLALTTERRDAIACRDKNDCPDRSDTEPSQRTEGFVHSEPGRYLWIKIELVGDGFDSPSLASLRAHFPRLSYLRELPAIFQEDREGKHFLELFLGSMQREWDQLDRRIDLFPKQLDPKRVAVGPSEDCLRYLRIFASWLGWSLEEDWSLERNRRLVAATAAAERNEKGQNRRGTRAHLKRIIQATFEPADTPSCGPDFPLIVEGFQERNYLQTSQSGADAVGAPTRLWSRDATRRAQLDAGIRLDEARLVSDGDPLLDVFRIHAHRFRVVVPASWVPNERELERLRSLIEREKPAHTVFEVEIFEPGLQIGVQATLGVDSLVWGDMPLSLGGIPADAFDAESGVLAPERVAVPQSMPRLGQSARLGGEPSPEPIVRSSSEAMLGVSTILIHNPGEKQ